MAGGLLVVLCLAGGEANATVITTGCGDASSDFGTACSLAELDPLGPGVGGTITINDKIFENWTANRTSSTFGNNDFFRAGIRVDPIDDPLKPGLKFVDTNGAWNHDVEFTNDDITFDVRVLSGQPLIQGVELISEIGRIASGTPPDGIDGFVHVDYLITPVVDQVETTCEFVSCANTTLADSLAFPPESLVHLSGSVNIISGQAPGAGAGAQLISHTVLISQTAAVPAPATLALLALGMASAGAWRRRQRRRPWAECHTPRRQVLIRPGSRRRPPSRALP